MIGKPALKVFYNSACPVCDAGIKNQMQKPSLCEIQWNDVHRDNALVNLLGAELEFVRKRLHVMDETGRIHMGFEAFLILWRQSTTERWKARLLGIPGIRQLCGAAYNLFAAGLYRWNRHRRHW